jgi:hypothetical protein
MNETHLAVLDRFEKQIKTRFNGIKKDQEMLVHSFQNFYALYTFQNSDEVLDLCPKYWVRDHPDSMHVFSIPHM